MKKSRSHVGHVEDGKGQGESRGQVDNETRSHAWVGDRALFVSFVAFHALMK